MFPNDLCLENQESQEAIYLIIDRSMYFQRGHFYPFVSKPEFVECLSFSRLADILRVWEESRSITQRHKIWKLN